MAIVNGYCTLEQLKDHLGIEDDRDGLMLEACVTAASREVDRHCGRRFWSDLSTSARVYRASRSDRVVVDDFSTTTGLTVYTDEGDTGTYGQAWTVTTDFVVYPFNGALDGIEGLPYWEVHGTGTRWFPCHGNRARVQVTAKWGWSAVPQAVYEATLLKAARLFRRKDSPEGIAGGFSDLGPIRISSREDPDVVMLLAPYVRPVVAA